jgi:chorismate dehydratase
MKSILLDYQSRTSVTLVKVLAKEQWKISPEWQNASEHFENSVSGTTAAVIIGDRTFGLENKYPYRYDLAEEWQKLTGLPFVFAAWVSNKKLPDDFIQKFNLALKLGLENINSISKSIQEQNQYPTNVNYYLTQNIDYRLDKPKREGLARFLSYLKSL